MRDAEAVAAMLAGDPAGLAAAYDRHGAALYTYCRALLTDPEEAADAVQATFLIAVAKLAHLQEPDQLRSWLYAIARNECHRRLRDLAAATGRADSADALRELAHVVADAERSEPQELVRTAIAGLGPDERDVIELSRDRSPDDAGHGALPGLAPEEVHALALRARKQFEDALGTLLIARAGRRFCVGLHSILADWDGRMAEVLRVRLNQHMESCPVCGQHASRPAPPPRSPAPQPPSAAPPPRPPSGASGRAGRPTLWLVTGDTAQHTDEAGHAPPRTTPEDGRRGEPARGRHSAAGGQPARAGGSAAGGDPPDGWRAPSSWVAAGAVVALAAVAVGVFFLTSGRHQGVAPPAGAATVPGIQAITSASPRQGSPGGAAPGPGTSQRTGPRPGPSGASAAPAPTPHTPTPPAPSHGPPTPGPPAPPGTLTAAPASVRLQAPAGRGPPAGSFRLTAHGGPVASFTISVPVAYAGVLTVAPASGSLEAGRSVQVTVTLLDGNRPGFQARLTVQPGNLSVQVSYQHQHGSGHDQSLGPVPFGPAGTAPSPVSYPWAVPPHARRGARPPSPQAPRS